MLTLQFIPFVEIKNLNSEQRINKILKLAKEEKIILLEGRLKQEEETELIRKTMETIKGKFKGIELTTIYPDKEYGNLFEKLKNSLINLILGSRQGLTIIGPASIVKEIKHDPEKIQLLTTESSSRRRK